MKRSALTFLVAVAAVAVISSAAVFIGQAAFAVSSPTTLEAAKHSATEAHGAILEDEARLSADKKRAASADAVVADIEAESPPKEPPAEEPPTTATVSASPTGPAGSWHVAFADAFGKPVGSGDTFWQAKTNSRGCCNNSNETSSENPVAVHQSEANGLELRCEGLVCSGVSTPAFTYQIGRGASFAFQTVAQLPNNSLGGGEDPGFWSISTTRWPPEFDFFEWWGWGSCESTPSSCLGGFPVYKSSGLGTHELYYRPGESGWTRFHTYTTVVEGSTFTEYVDGVKTGSFTQSVNTDAMRLILTHAIRVSTRSRSSSFNVRSVAVYEDSAHAGQFVSGGGVAPGTSVK
jgi:hypothetical protein